VDRMASAHPDVPHVSPSGAEGEGPTRAAPRCRACEGEMRFAGGVSTHDLWAERYVCPSCGHETFRSFGRGSVS
jgi:hypothetical protein